MVKVTKCPPGEAIGARDLQKWGRRRAAGKGGAGRTKKDRSAPGGASEATVGQEIEPASLSLPSQGWKP